MRKNEFKSGSGELAVIWEIRRRAMRLNPQGLRLGIGDDCAILRVRPGEELAVTTDLSIAGRHFLLDAHPAEAVGHRTLARGLSDLAAMGARPVAAFLSLGLPKELTERRGRQKTWVDRFLDGLLALADAHATPLAGGDLAESPVAVADIVLVGAVPQGRAMLRSGSRAGDLLYVTGSLGGAAVGLDELKVWAALKGRARLKDGAGKSGGKGGPIPKGLGTRLARHLYPQPRIAAGLWLQRRGLATAAIDLSDGLSTDLAHLCEESGVRAVVDAKALPVAESATLNEALHGGEDYELLFTAEPTVRIPRSIAGVPVTRIGHMVRRRKNDSEITLKTANGSEPLKPRGWQHFA